jgi:hypothetical protein
LQFVITANRVTETCVHQKLMTDPFLIVDDGFEPEEVLLFERHHDHQGFRVVIQAWVVGRGLRVEEPHGGLVAHVLLIAPYWSVI